MSTPKGNILIALLRNDLRLHDHPVFHVASKPAPKASNTLTHSLRFSQPITHLLPIYVLDPVFLPLAGLPHAPSADAPTTTRTLSLWRTSPHRLSYLAHSLADLASSLRAKGSDLHVYAGRPERVIADLVKRIEARGYRVEGVAMTKEVNSEELRTQARVRRAAEAASQDASRKPRVYTTEAKPLVPRSVLPFELKELPDVYTHFRKRVEAIPPDETSCQYMGAILEPLPTPDALLPLPEGVVEHAEDAYLLDGKDERASLADVPALIKQLIQPILDSPTLGIKKGAHLQATAADAGEKVGQDGGKTADVPSAFPFKGGETEALKRLEHYLGGPNAPGVKYKETRNGMLGEDYSTKFAAALAHGTISPRTIAVRALAMDDAVGRGSGGGYWVVFELLWRDYFYYVGARFRTALFHLDGIAASMPSKGSNDAAQRNYPGANGNKKADADGWVRSKTLDDKEDAFVRWAEGRTGVPLIDANMRELIATGFMSNRGRQNVASFLTKDLGYDWRYGAEYFESLLTDYDTNSNWGNWQYVAGVGNDPRASRQFNPIKQAHDYDPQGEYVKAWLPELRNVPTHAVQHPWTLNLSQDGIDIGDYPGRPVLENKGMWGRHYWRDGGGGGGGGGGGRGGGGGGGYRGRGRGGNGGRGRGRGRGRGGHQGEN